jgi:CheY-like chemotaxis protein
MTDDLAQRPIVVIEDSDEDYEVTVWALREAGVANPVHRCANGPAIAGLWADHATWPSALTAAYPLLVLLDLNLPGSDWRDTLHHLRNDYWWQPVPVVILSTSKHPADVSACYRMGAAGYLLKPLNLDAFAAGMRCLAAYWLETVVPPVPF